MKPSEIRRELLEQHAVLRTLMAQSCTATERWRLGEASERDARDCLARLLDALRRHNLGEEELLRGVLPGVDAWGTVRAEIMSEEHVAEHRELYTAFGEAAAQPRACDASRRIGALCQRLLEHMAREESSFLTEDVLRDDMVAVDSFAG